MGIVGSMSAGKYGEAAPQLLDLHLMSNSLQDYTEKWTSWGL